MVTPSQKRKKAVVEAQAVSVRYELKSPVFDDADLVDRIFEYVVQLHPELRSNQAEITQAVREEFGGRQVWIGTAQDLRRRELARKVLSMFNGRNATEVARVLRVSRATVYRILKQPRLAPT
jgi:Mor family transcriptional regulator